MILRILTQLKIELKIARLNTTCVTFCKIAIQKHQSMMNLIFLRGISFQKLKRWEAIISSHSMAGAPLFSQPSQSRLVCPSFPFRLICLFKQVVISHSFRFFSFLFLPISSIRTDCRSLAGIPFSLTQRYFSRLHG